MQATEYYLKDYLKDIGLKPEFFLVEGKLVNHYTTIIIIIITLPQYVKYDTMKQIHP